MNATGLMILCGVLVGCGSSGDDTTPPSTAADSGSSGGIKDAATPSAGEGNGFRWAFSPTSVAFHCSDTPEAILAKKPTQLTFGSATIVVGMEQISATDQDPLVARIDDGKLTFCEHSKKGGGVDARAYGLTWNGKDTLYVVYTVVGGGTLFDTVAKGGWLSSYGDGGASAKATVIGRVDVTTGVVLQATFVSSKVNKSGQLKTNTLIPADAVHVTDKGELEFFGTPTYCTLNPDHSLMCTAGVSSEYPKNYRARFAPDLTTMVCASADGVAIVKAPCR